MNWIIPLYIVFYTFKSVYNGMLLNLFKTKQALYPVYIIWFVSYPIGLTLCYGYDWELRGLWFGMALGNIVAAVYLVFLF
jgi:Na+-driven multidrug efflux pump